MLAQMLAHGITKISGKEPMVGVSSVFQIGLVQRGRSAIADHEFTLWRGGGKQERITPPPLAKGWQEFERFCRASSLDAATAEC
jgi:hypothetical protein